MRTEAHSWSARTPIAVCATSSSSGKRWIGLHFAPGPPAIQADRDVRNQTGLDGRVDVDLEHEIRGREQHDRHPTCGRGRSPPRLARDGHGRACGARTPSSASSWPRSASQSWTSVPTCTVRHRCCLSSPRTCGKTRGRRRRRRGRPGQPVWPGQPVYAAMPARAWPGPPWRGRGVRASLFCGRECDLAAIGQLFWEMRAC